MAAFMNRLGDVVTPTSLAWKTAAEHSTRPSTTSCANRRGSGPQLQSRPGRQCRALVRGHRPQVVPMSIVFSTDGVRPGPRSLDIDFPANPKATWDHDSTLTCRRGPIRGPLDDRAPLCSHDHGDPSAANAVSSWTVSSVTLLNKGGDMKPNFVALASSRGSPYQRRCSRRPVPASATSTISVFVECRVLKTGRPLAARAQRCIVPISWYSLFDGAS